MKPSQVSNKLSHPPPRRMLPLQSPELCHRDRLSPPQHPLYRQGAIHSSGFIPNSPVNIGSSANRPQPKPGDRLGSVHHSVQPPGSSRSQLVPVSSADSDTTANRSQLSPPGISNPASPQLIKDLSNHSRPSHNGSDELNNSQITLFYARGKNVMAKRQESNKVLFYLFLYMTITETYIHLKIACLWPQSCDVELWLLTFAFLGSIQQHEQFQKCCPAPRAPSEPITQNQNSLPSASLWLWAM